MAEIIVLNAEVIRLIPNYGAVVSEKFKDSQGEERKNYYTVWTNETLTVGDEISIRGILRVKLDEYTNQQGEVKRSAQAHINNPKIEKEMPF